MPNVYSDFYHDRVQLYLTPDEARLLAQVFDLASRDASGKPFDQGWVETSEALAEIADKVGVQNGAARSDYELEVKVIDDTVRMAFDLGLADVIGMELENAIPDLLTSDWFKIADQIRLAAKDMTDKD